MGSSIGFFFLWNDMGQNLTLWSFSLHCLCASQVPFDAVQWMNRLGKPPRAYYSGNAYSGSNLDKACLNFKRAQKKWGAFNCDYPRCAMMKLYFYCYFRLVIIQFWVYKQCMQLSQFYIQLVYRPHFGTWTLISNWAVWASQGSKKKKWILVFLSNFWGCFFQLFEDKQTTQI